MITAQTEPAFDALASTLTEAAQTLAEAGAHSAAMARGGDPLRWRRPGLVWPLFAARLAKKG